MSSRQQGNARENRFGALLEARGYVVFYSRGSRGTDILAVGPGFASAAHLLVAISRPSYTSVREPFEKLRSGPSIPGARHLLAREIKRAGRRAWRVYIDEDTYFDDIDAALVALREP